MMSAFFRLRHGKPLVPQETLSISMSVPGISQTLRHCHGIAECMKIKMTTHAFLETANIKVCNRTVSTVGVFVSSGVLSVASE